jgi:hypothetical protein
MHELRTISSRAGVRKATGRSSLPGSAIKRTGGCLNPKETDSTKRLRGRPHTKRRVRDAVSRQAAWRFMVRRHVFRFTQKACIVQHDRHIRFVPGAGSRAQQIIAYILPLSTTRVCALKLGNLLIIQRYGSTPVRLFANKVVLRGGLMTTQARQPLRVIDDVFAPFADLGSSRRNI